uniref:Putative secreted protein n=1 Tax=Anopheles marajoara TaxID=58244 RepID=A0A2M4CE64_9DIPT
MAALLLIATPCSTLNGHTHTHERALSRTVSHTEARLLAGWSDSGRIDPSFTPYAHRIMATFALLTGGWLEAG